MGGSCTLTMSRNIRWVVFAVSSSSEQVFEGVGRDFGFGGRFDGLRAAEVRFRGLRLRWKGEGNGGGGGGRVRFWSEQG